MHALTVTKLTNFVDGSYIFKVSTPVRSQRQEMLIININNIYNGCTIKKLRSVNLMVQ